MRAITWHLSWLGSSPGHGFESPIWSGGEWRVCPPWFWCRAVVCRTSPPPPGPGASLSARLPPPSVGGTLVGIGLVLVMMRKRKDQGLTPAA
jgi:hypothetical protein